MLKISAEKDWRPVCFDDPQQTLVHLFRLVVDEYISNAEGKEEMIAAALVQLEIAIDRMQAQRTESERIVTQAKRLIEEGYSRQIRVADVAQGVGVCPTTLRTTSTASAAPALSTICSRCGSTMQPHF